MKILHTHCVAAVLFGAMATSNPAFANHGNDKGKLVPVAEEDAAWVAKAKAEYSTKAASRRRPPT